LLLIAGLLKVSFLLSSSHEEGLTVYDTTHERRELIVIAPQLGNDVINGASIRKLQTASERVRQHLPGDQFCEFVLSLLQNAG
jgi:hypothetical protein